LNLDSTMSLFSLYISLPVSSLKPQLQLSLAISDPCLLISPTIVLFCLLILYYLFRSCTRTRHRRAHLEPWSSENCDTCRSYPGHVQPFFSTGLATECLFLYPWEAYLPHRHYQDKLELSVVVPIAKQVQEVYEVIQAVVEVLYTSEDYEVVVEVLAATVKV
jgi:hypothetical protein